MIAYFISGYLVNPVEQYPRIFSKGEDFLHLRR